jgi:hypothetical protein
MVAPFSINQDSDRLSGGKDGLLLDRSVIAHVLVSAFWR